VQHRSPRFLAPLALAGKRLLLPVAERSVG